MEADDLLTQVSIFYQGTNGGALIGLNGGQIGSDGTFGACFAGECDVTGYWTSRAVPEPTSLVLFASALLGLKLLQWGRKGSHV
jgi:PEP-CTERM motif